MSARPLHQAPLLALYERLESLAMEQPAAARGEP